MSDPYANMDVEEDDHIKVSSSEEADFMEFPKEENNSVTLSTIHSQFPDAIGIKYKGASGAWRAIRAVDNILDPPKGGWGDRVYIVTLPENIKRKSDNNIEYGARDSKVSRPEPIVDPLLKDMAVIGLPYKTTTEELREYFETNYGELSYSEVKKDRATGNSRGFGFIRFKDAECAKAALNAEHYMNGRKVEVRQKKDKAMKLFVGRLSSGTTQEELNKYFSQYGELTDTYIPTPFRNFAFITMASTEDAKALLRDNHVLNGAHLNVMIRNPDNRSREGGESRDGGGQQRSEGRGQSSYSAQGGGGAAAGGGGGGGASRGGYSASASRPADGSNVNAAELKNMLFQLLTS